MNKEVQVQRHELKYYISYADYESARLFLRQLMSFDSRLGDERGYFIRSLYLDDTQGSSVEEKLAGIEKRDKYRLRIYETEQDWVKLERKRKHNNYAQKSTAVITRDEALAIARGDYRDLLKYKSQAHNSIFFDLKRKFFYPVVIVDYIREAYMLDYNNIRVTFDKKLRCSNYNHDIFDANLMTEPLLRDDVVIMEVKFNHFLPSWFKEAMKFDSACISAISKYCQSRMRIKEYYNV